MSFMSCRETKDAQSFSEFAENGYNRSSFCEFVRGCLHDEELMTSDFSDCLNKTVIKLNAFFDTNKNNGTNRSFNFLKAKKYIEETLSEDNQDIIKLDLSDYDSDKTDTLDVNNELEELRSALSEFSNSKQYDDKLAEKYLNAFLNVSRRIVFNPNNVNLNSMLFRRMKTVENLNCLGRIPFDDSKLSEKGCSYFSIYSPYVCDTVMRIIHDIAHNKSRFHVKSDSDMLRELRYEMYIRQVERAFTRFTSYNNATGYRATLNRHSGEIISVPYNDLTSIEDIKPLRLFEKIAVYIKHEAEKLIEKNRNSGEGKNKKLKLKINILIIGHTEMSFDNSKSSDDKEYKDERELCDLLNVIINWYNRSFSEEDPKLDICINNLVNENDAPEAKNVIEQGRYNVERTVNGNYGIVKVQSCNFVTEFYFSSSKLQEICSENDVVFILDCPWLSVESYEIKNDGSLKYFCEDFQNDSLRNKEADSLDKHWKTTMQRLDTQYNRITSSDTDKAGDIARIFFDGLLRKIRKFASETNSDKGKEIYIFTSEKDGVDYSFLASYPLTRVELYGAKRFTIARFSSEKSSVLACNDEPIRIRIKLWSLLKYISIAYAIEKIKKLILEYMDGYIKESENYIEILRDIVILIEVGSQLGDLNISICFTDRFDILAQELEIPDEELNEIKSKLHHSMLEFVMSVYNGIVFADKYNFADELIKNAFEMNVYSSSDNVYAMHFLHYYKKARKKNQISNSFKIIWNKDYCAENTKSLPDSNFNHEYFKDKKLYSSLFEILETTGNLSIGTRAMLFSADDLFVNNYYMAERVLSNIVASCEKCNCIDSTLYSNARYALKELP